MGVTDRKIFSNLNIIENPNTTKFKKNLQVFNNTQRERERKRVRLYKKGCQTLKIIMFIKPSSTTHINSNNQQHVSKKNKSKER